MTAETVYSAPAADDPVRDLHSAVRRFDRRRRTQQTVAWLPRGLMAALILALILALIARMRPLLTNVQVGLFALAVAIAAVILCLLVIWGRRKSMITLAQRFDLDFGLRERVSTALELNSGRIRAPEWLAAEQLADAQVAAAAAAESVPEKMPLRFSVRDWLMVIALVATMIVLLILPNPAADALSRNAAVTEAINAAAEDMQEVVEDIAADPSLDEAERQALLEDLRQRIDSLQNPEITPEEAFASLGEVSAEMQERADQLGARSSASQQALQNTADALRQAGDGSQTGSESTEPMEQITTNLQQISQNASEMTEEQRQQAAQALRDASAALQNSQESTTGGQNSNQQQAAESLEQAAQSLENNESQNAQQQLSQAQQQLQQSSQQSQQQQQGQQSLSEAAQQARDAASEISEAQQQAQQNGQQMTEQSGEQEGERGSPQQGDQAAGQPQQNGAPSLGEGSQQSPQGQLSESAQGQAQAEGEQGAPSDQNNTSAQAGDAAGSSESDNPNAVPGEQTTAAQNNDPDGSGQRDYEAVNVPQRAGGDFGEDVIQLDADASDSPVEEGDFAQNPDGQVTIPYDQVYGTYRDAADRALDSGYVPLALRDVVRDYFTSLEPRR